MAGRYSIPFADTVAINQEYHGFTPTSSGAGSVVILSQLSLFGAGTSSTDIFRLYVGRPSGTKGTFGGTIAAGSVPKLSNISGNAAASYSDGTAFSVDSTTPVELMGPVINGFGGIYRFVAPPGSEIVTVYAGADTQLVMGYSLAGSATISVDYVVEEL